MSVLVIPIPEREANVVAARMGFPGGWGTLDLAGRRAVAMELYRGQIDAQSQYYYELLSTNNPNANDFQLVMSPSEPSTGQTKPNTAILVLLAAGLILYLGT